jgi:hypothetical protein
VTLDDLAATGGLLAPWPAAIGKRVIPGQRMAVSPICEKKCGAVPDCNLLPGSVGEHICPHGLSFYISTIGAERVTVFGVRGDLSKKTGVRHLKEALKGRTVTVAEVQSWTASVQALLNEISADFLRRQAEMLEPLHDPMRLVRQIVQLSSSIALSATGAATIEDALLRASPDMKSLVKAADFLNESFDMLTIYFNPEAASFPKRYPFSLYGMLKKIVSMFTVADDSQGSLRHHSIYLNGSSFRNVYLRENFKLIPFALITNAIKYSLDGPVRVGIVDIRSDATEVSVESLGPAIEADELPRLYEKKFRGRWAKRHSSGSGVGLYLADAVARANGIELRAASSPTGQKSGDIPLAMNRFWFEVPSR